MAKRVVMALFGALLLASEASAQTDKDQQAKEEYEAGIVQYNLTNYDRAIEHFKKSYELVRAPALLFNIAQAYRLKKDCESAKRFYTNYQREQSAKNPGDPNIKEAETFIAEMDRCLAATGGGGTGATGATGTTTPPTTEPGRTTPPAATTTPTPLGTTTTTTTTTTAPPAPPETPDEPSKPGSGMKTAGMVLGAAGVVFAGTGVYFWIRSRQLNDKAMDECTVGADCPWDDKGKRANLLAWGLGVGGLALAGTGGYLYYLGLSRQSSTEVSLIPTDGGAAFLLSGRF